MKCLRNPKKVWTLEIFLKHSEKFENSKILKELEKGKKSWRSKKSLETRKYWGKNEKLEQSPKAPIPRLCRHLEEAK